MVTIILAGGKSWRMGRDKAIILRPDGIRQADWLAGIARKAAGGEIFLSIRGDSPKPLDLPLVFDAEPGGGPLAALASIHSDHPDEAVLVLGCDLFLLDEETLRHLITNRDPSRNATAYANRIDSRPEPLCAIYEVSGISRAADWIARGDFHLRHFLESLDPAVLELPHPAALDNANTPHELAECFEKLKRGVALKSVEVTYGGLLAERRGLTLEKVQTLACTVGGLFEELCFRHHLRTCIPASEATLNGSASSWDHPLQEGDEVVFLPLREHSPG